MEKEFGLYDRIDLRFLIEQFKEMESQDADLVAAIPGILRKKLSDKFNWLSLWDKSFLELVSLQAYVFLQDDQIASVMSSENPQQALAQLASSDSEQAPRIDNNDLILALTMAVFRTFNAIRFYGYPLNDFVAAYCRMGDDELLFKILRIDRSFAGHAKVGYRLALAEAERDQRFFKSFASALNGAPHRSRLEYGELRLLLTALAETKTKLTQDSAYELFCEDLGVYPHDGEDAALSLWQFIKRWEKERPT